MHELVYMMGQPLFVQCHQWSRVGGANTIYTSCYLAILSIEYDLSQKLDLEAVAIVAS